VSDAPRQSARAPVRKATPSREVLHRPAAPFGDPLHEAEGDAALASLLAGTDAEGYLGDRVLAAAARAALAAAWGAPACVLEAYRLRNADRVEVVFAPRSAKARALGGVPGSWLEGVSWAVEVTRADDLAFRVCPLLRRTDAAGWVLFDPGEVPALARARGRDALLAAQADAIRAGLSLATEARAAIEERASVPVDVAAALKTTSLPLTVRTEAARGLDTVAALGEAAAGLARVAAEREREEGEAYARGAGRMLRPRTVGLAGQTPPVPPSRPA